jgi:tetratricopeptide (TPR) repeat protein
MSTQIKYLSIIAAFVMVVGCQQSMPSPSPTPVKKAECGALHPWYLLDSGKVEEARRGYACLVAVAERQNDLVQQWETLIGYSWFLHQIGENKEAILLSNRALEIAEVLKDIARKGRTLSWLGWAYAELGLYELAEQLYHEAIELGAPKGVIRYAHLWGLSTQELGYLKMRRGDLKSARALLMTTLSYARKHGIDVGIAEGGAHLAEISLIEGRYKEGDAFATEAYEASLRCNCSPLNTARAMMVRARVAREFQKSDPKRKEYVENLISELVAYVDKHQIQRVKAEALILKSSLFMPNDYDSRYPLVAAALDILAHIENEQRGVAMVELGRVFLENNRHELAQRYLQSGIKVQEALFRSVDEAEARASLSELSFISGDSGERLRTLQLSAENAHRSGALPLALSYQEKLAEELAVLGYVDLSIAWGERARATVVSLIDISNSVEVKKTLYEKKLHIGLLLAEQEIKRLPAPSSSKGKV